MSLKQKAEDWVRRHERIRKVAGKIIQVIRFPYYAFTDLRERFSSERDELVPPMRMRHLVGDEKEYKEVGEEYLKIFTELCELKPNERVLDVGCGVGRMARPLARYLNEAGSSYEGFDIVAKEIKWDKRAFESRFPNFRFQLADIYNKEFNPKGKFKAAEYKFPFESGFFDFVFLTSVFTHMLKEDMENYFGEIARVLKPRGRCLISCFLLNPDSLKQIGTKESHMDFQYEIDGDRTVDEEKPEIAIAYKEETMRELCDENKLKIVEPIHYGWWCKRESPLTFQDVIVAMKQ